MANRNIKKMISEGRELESRDGYRYSLNVEELKELFEESGASPQTIDNVLTLIINAYCVGMVSGRRQCRKDLKR